MSDPHHRYQQIPSLIGVDHVVFADAESAESLPGRSHDLSLIGVAAKIFDRRN
jgi:hypothetical protein